jgi:hypothetical protein
MLRKGALLGWERLLVITAASLFCFHSLNPECGADYVETFPRPGASLPPPIAPGKCPLVFLQADIQHADLSAYSSGKRKSDTLRLSSTFIAKCKASQRNWGPDCDGHASVSSISAAFQPNSILRPVHRQAPFSYLIFKFYAVCSCFLRTDF